MGCGSEVDRDTMRRRDMRASVRRCDDVWRVQINPRSCKAEEPKQDIYYRLTVSLSVPALVAAMAQSRFDVVTGK